MTPYDAVVVGAGPAGAIAAGLIARAGARVLLIERQRIPRPKVCGGGLSPKAYHLLPIDISDLVLTKSNRVYLAGKRIGKFLLEAKAEPIWMVERASFDERLAQVAHANGAEVHDGEPLERIEPGKRVTVRTARATYQADVLVGADGAESVIAKTVGLRPNRNRRYVLGLETETPVQSDPLGDRSIVAFLLPYGYFWVFPKGRRYNIGVGTADRRLFSSLRQRLQEFIADLGIELAESPCFVGHRIPIWTGHEPLSASNVLLVGDAAGLADPFFGEGIAYAIKSGQIAAQSAIDYLEGQRTALDEYSASIWQEIGAELAAWHRLGQLVYPIPDLWLWLLHKSRLGQRPRL